MNDKNNQSLDEHIPINILKNMVHDLLADLNNPDDKILIKNKKSVQLLQKYGKKYAELQLRYPALFNMIIDTGSEFDMKQFQMMINSIERVRNNQVKEQDASKQFGQDMYDKYVKPKLG